MCSDALQQAAGSTRRWQKCLDLGCGTGLMGPLLRPFVATLEGVDLSAGMVEQARQRQCYDSLQVMELVEYLHQYRGLQQSTVHATGRSQQGADLLVAADVFVYLGDLHPVMAAAARCCAPAAHLCFSTEEAVAPVSEGCGYQVQPTGRFKHGMAYVEDVAASTGWTVLHSESSIIRYNSGKPVHGSLYVMQQAVPL
jgi:predicted TPR repeat methyltransferase